MFLKFVSHEKILHPVVYCIEIDSNIIMTDRTKPINTNIKKILNAEEYSDELFRNDYVFIGPKHGMISPWCSNMIQIFNNCITAQFTARG